MADYKPIRLENAVERARPARGACTANQTGAQLFWRIEAAFSDINATLKGAEIVLRSKTPELVRQEFWR